MLLKELIRNIPEEKKKIKIRGLALNSKKVKKGYIFFAIKGNKLSGENYIKDAVKKGACLIVCSKNYSTKHLKIPSIKTKNVRHLLSEISSKFYKLKPKNIIAVTGTNGKTSVADLFYQILNLNGIPVASIGTLGFKLKKKIIKTNLTSPDTISFHQILDKIKKNKIDNVIIEASSHGLDQNRIDHLNIKAGIFTNFSRDHLDYHKSMRSYLNSKLILFKKILKRNKTIISDENIKEFLILKRIAKARGLHLIDIDKIKKKIPNYRLSTFQKNNLAMAIAAAKLCNLNEEKIFNSLKKIKDVPGRLELVRTLTNNVKVYVDFAHTPDALLKTIKALKKLNNENISLVFGCGGDRDVKKRSIMARIADLNCRKVYVTDDNPRNEKPEKIRKEILKNIKKSKSFNIGNRYQAIKTAIENTEPNEVILVAGKGHEEEQIYKNKIILASDKNIVKAIKLKKKKASLKKNIFLENKKIVSYLSKGKNIKDFHGLSIDSRKVKKGNLFLTIKGKKNDGLYFIPQALKKGAKQIITSRHIRKFNKYIFRVNNETFFLKSFAALKRDLTKAKIIAITGSAGKTSLKDLIKFLLQNFGRTFGSPQSYNNHFGVPLSLSHLSPEHQFGIFEIGMSKAGEINKLSKLVKPHFGIITNIGEAHIENFKNLKGIADAKGELINSIQKGGVLFLNRDDKYFNYLKKKAELKDLKIVSFGINKNSDVFPIYISKNKDKYKVSVKGQKLNFKLKNINVYNLLASLAILNELKLDLSKISKLFKHYEPTDGRGKIHFIKRYKKNFKLIDESYNANPLSVKNAIQNFNSLKKKNFKKYLLLGDMLELGKKSEILHKRVSEVINKSDIDKVFIKGNKTLTTFKNINKSKRGNIFQQEEDVDYTFNNIISNNDHLMIKGSNATGLNNFSKKIIKGY